MSKSCQNVFKNPMKLLILMDENMPDLWEMP